MSGKRIEGLKSFKKSAGAILAPFNIRHRKAQRIQLVEINTFYCYAGR
jgi:hypothetical protein